MTTETDHEIDALVALLDPVDERTLATPALREAELALRETVLRGSRRPPRREHRRRAPKLLAGLAVVAVAAVAFAAITGRDPASTGTAWAAPLVRLAESSPLLLLDDPAWSVKRADEYGEREGEMTFKRGAEPVDVQSAQDRKRTADLHWRRGPVARWKKDRAHEADLVVQRSVLGQRAQIIRYPDSTDYAAIWADGARRVLEFRADAPSLAAFEQMLAALKRVDVDAWLSALPAGVVKAANRADAVDEMLAGIPLPPGLELSTIKSEETINDRYQLGARVTGAVACAWIARWAAARRRGDTTQERAAVAAMQTAHGWKILDEMESEGAWSEVLRGYADAMRSGDGTWHGRPLLREVQGGLGCAGR